MAARRILVKDAPGVQNARLSLGAARVAFAATPLFRSIKPTPVLGAAAPNVWQILAPEPGFVEENPWDVCHSLLQQGFGVANAAAPEFAEPDLDRTFHCLRLES